MRAVTSGFVGTTQVTPELTKLIQQNEPLNKKEGGSPTGRRRYAPSKTVISFSLRREIGADGA